MKIKSLNGDQKQIIQTKQIGKSSPTRDYQQKKVIRALRAPPPPKKKMKRSKKDA